MAYLARRRGDRDQSESYFKEAERVDPRNIPLLEGHESSYLMLHRFHEELRKLDKILDIVPDDMYNVAQKSLIAQAEGELPRAAALLAPLQPGADYVYPSEVQSYQVILVRR